MTIYQNRIHAIPIAHHAYYEEENYLLSHTESSMFIKINGIDSVDLFT